MKVMAGATTLGNMAGALGAHAEEASIVAELKAGSEEAYHWLINRFHQPVYSLIYRIVNDPADAADTTQEVFLKVFRGMRRFNGEASLKTWVYRIAVHEASNRRRWWFRHKSKETSLEPEPERGAEKPSGLGLKDTLAGDDASPYDAMVSRELRERVEEELRHVPEPFRTTLVLRDLEELSYEEIAEVTGATLGTVKSRLMRGREALRKRLAPFVQRAAGSAGASRQPAREQGIEVKS
jgi:RNA polymerase sigma-70 factor (ECF subfamily)